MDRETPTDKFPPSRQPAQRQAQLNNFLDTFFHLPTLITFALIALVLLWQIYDAGLHVSTTFIRLNSNQGHITLYWTDGCCQLDW